MLQPILGIAKGFKTEKSKYKQNTVVSLLLKQTRSRTLSLSQKRFIGTKGLSATACSKDIINKINHVIHNYKCFTLKAEK